MPFDLQSLLRYQGDRFFAIKICIQAAEDPSPLFLGLQTIALCLCSFVLNLRGGVESLTGPKGLHPGGQWRIRVSLSRHSYKVVTMMWPQ